MGARHRLVVVAGHSRYGRHAIRHDPFQWTAALGRWHRRLRLVLLTTMAVGTAPAFRAPTTAAAGRFRIRSTDGATSGCIRWGGTTAVFDVIRLAACVAAHTFTRCRRQTLQGC